MNPTVNLDVFVDLFYAFPLAFIMWIIYLLFKFIRTKAGKPLNGVITILMVMFFLLLTFFFGFYIKIILHMAMGGDIKYGVIPLYYFSFCIFFYGVIRWYKVLKKENEHNDENVKKPKDVSKAEMKDSKSKS